MRKLMLSIALLIACGEAAFATDLYVGPTTAGSANCSSLGNRCLFATARALAVAGDTIMLDDGHYTGVNSMIRITAANGAANGSAGNPITVSARNDGGALIDGENARLPVEIVGRSYWILEGFNATAGYTGNLDAVEIGPGASNNIIRRVCAWDADVSTNSAVFWVYGGDHNLLEDICAFGTGRKAIVVSGSGDSTVTIRRAWAMWNKSVSTVTGSTTCEWDYDSKNTIWENVICTADEDVGSDPESFEGIGLSRGDEDGVYTCGNLKVLGSIIYHLNSQTSPSGDQPLYVGNQMGQYSDCQTVRNTVSYMEKALPPTRLMNVSAIVGGPTGQTQIFANGTDIGPTASDILGSDWTITNRSSGTNVAAVPNIWNGGGTSGARVCYRYVNGTLTATPLWPWPMNQRIIDALTAAGRTPIDVTATMESIFGTIPDECRSDVSTPPGTITVTGPAGPCASASVCQVTWEHFDITGSVDIYYLVGGNEYAIATVPYNSSPYNWTVNAPASTSSTIRIKQGAITDDSSTFTIYGTRSLSAQ